MLINVICRRNDEVIPIDWFNQSIKGNAVCFSGHRPERLPDKGNPNGDDMRLIRYLLQKKIDNLIFTGIDVFINGFMAGWDILASLEVISLKDEYPHIRLITVAPYAVDYFNHGHFWTDEWIGMAHKVKQHSDLSINISERFHPAVYIAFTQVLLANSNTMICYWDGGVGGTEYTVKHAEEKGLQIVNLFEEYTRHFEMN